MTDEESGHVLYVVTCATPAARDIGKLVGLAQERDWTVCVIATPLALRFIDQAALEEQTGYPVRSDYKQPGTEDVLPPADAIIVGGASFNTINKWANGISDTYALGILAEAPGLGIPVVVLPFVNSALAGRVPFKDSVDALRSEGAQILLGPGEFEPHPPGSGGERISDFPWELALSRLAAAVRVVRVHSAYFGLLNVLPN